MKRFATLFVALGLATAGSTVLAEQKDQQVGTQNSKPQPVQMSEAELDNVAAGALLNVVVVDVADVNDVAVQIPIEIAANANAAVAILGTAGAAAAQRISDTRPGNTIIRQ